MCRVQWAGCTAGTRVGFHVAPLGPSAYAPRGLSQGWARTANQSPATWCQACPLQPCTLPSPQPELTRTCMKCRLHTGLPNFQNTHTNPCPPAPLAPLQLCRLPAVPAAHTRRPLSRGGKRGGAGAEPERRGRLPGVHHTRGGGVLRWASLLEWLGGFSGVGGWLTEGGWLAWRLLSWQQSSACRCDRVEVVMSGWHAGRPPEDPSLPLATAISRPPAPFDPRQST